jgi:rhomboid protease GluP
MERKPPASSVTHLTADSPEDVRIFSLVLDAAHIPHTLSPRNPSSWDIVVPDHLAERAEFEIAAYKEENADWPLQFPALEDFRPTFRILSLFIVGLLGLFFLQTGTWDRQSEWFTAGAGDSRAILGDGQYFRLITALTLHADGIHLLGNCILGGFLLHYFFHLMGNGIGLASLLITATLANALNVIAHGPGHHFVGFSTAVFSVIGMLSSLNFRRHAVLGRTHRLMPLMAGSAMLAMVGSSGEHTDLGAHFFGLVIGLAAGYLLGLESTRRLRTSFRLQTFLAVLTLGCCLLAWKIALA